MPMVAVVRCRPDEFERLKFNMRLGTRHGYEATLEVTRAREEWTSGGGLTLVLDPSEFSERISYLGWTSISSRKWSGDLDRVVEVSRMEPVEPVVLYKDVLARLSRRQVSRLADQGPQTKATGEALVAALAELRPDLRGSIDEIGGISRRLPISGSAAGQVIALQRDASIAAVRMAGMLGRSHFARWDRPRAALADNDVPPTFLEGVPQEQEVGED